jgi:hypothetical protein
MSDEANLEELALLLDELVHELARTTDSQRRTQIATEISELTLQIHTLRDESGKKSIPS